MKKLKQPWINEKLNMGWRNTGVFPPVKFTKPKKKKTKGDKEV